MTIRQILENLNEGYQSRAIKQLNRLIDKKTRYLMDNYMRELNNTGFDISTYKNEIKAYEDLKQYVMQAIHIWLGDFKSAENDLFSYLELHQKIDYEQIDIRDIFGTIERVIATIEKDRDFVAGLSDPVYSDSEEMMDAVLYSIEEFLDSPGERKNCLSLITGYVGR